MDENFISHGFGLTTSDETDNREAIWTIRRLNGQVTLYYRAVVRQIDVDGPHTLTRVPPVIPSEFVGAERAAADAFLDEIRSSSADTDSLVSNMLKKLKRTRSEDNVALLLGKQTSALKRTEIAARLLSQANIPARIVQGIFLFEQLKNAAVMPYLEVFDNGIWKYYNPDTGHEGLPDNFLIWWKGPKPLIELVGGNWQRSSISVTRNEEDALNNALVRGSINSPMLLEFSLFNLPLQTQGTYRVLLLVPVGALIVVIFRNIIGLKTFGTFMPVLIALAFRETQLAAGVFLFALIVALGLTVRFYLDHLKLLLVPRLAAMLTIVILLMATISVVSHKLGFGYGISIALFPMVIITMTIERMCIVWEELGPADALSQGIGSLFSASVIHLVNTAPHMEHLFFVFPELLFVVLAINLALGRYTGYRLSELKRFRDLASPE